MWSSQIVINCIRATKRTFSTNIDKYPIQFARTRDGSTIVAWHKPNEFPYECTKPLPSEEVKETDSVLKAQLSPHTFDIYNMKKPELARLELMKITHTTKHRWFPRARDKKAKRTPMDREYL